MEAMTVIREPAETQRVLRTQGSPQGYHCCSSPAWWRAHSRWSSQSSRFRPKPGQCPKPGQWPVRKTTVFGTDWVLEDRYRLCISTIKYRYWLGIGNFGNRFNRFYRSVTVAPIHLQFLPGKLFTKGNFYAHLAQRRLSWGREVTWTCARSPDHRRGTCIPFSLSMRLSWGRGVITTAYAYYESAIWYNIQYDW